MNSQKLVMAPMILTIVVASALLVLGPSTLGNAQAQMYNNDNEYGYDNSYNNDHYPEPKSPHTDIQKINCGNSNININGIDMNQISKRPNDLATTSSGTAANQQQDGTNGNGLSDSLNVERNLVNVCVNVNQNDQLKVEPPEESATLTVNKEIFGCTTTDPNRMDCQDIQDGDDAWLQCDNPAISETTACQNLVENLFDLEVLNDQNTQIQQFEGSAQGTTIEDLSPGTYSVNEIKVPPLPPNQLTESEPNENLCDALGFDDGGSLRLIPEFIGYAICFEYEDEQGNDCSTLTLQSGEDKICTVKNYIVAQDFFD